MLQLHTIINWSTDIRSIDKIITSKNLPILTCLACSVNVVHIYLRYIQLPNLCLSEEMRYISWVILSYMLRDTLHILTVMLSISISEGLIFFSFLMCHASGWAVYTSIIASSFGGQWTHNQCNGKFPFVVGIINEEGELITKIWSVSISGWSLCTISYKWLWKEVISKKEKNYRNDELEEIPLHQ